MERPRWRATALAFAAAALLGLSASDASALALGRVTVQSALGEPLRAEIDIPEISAEELASLRTNVAAPDAFKAAGLEYNPALAGVRITLEKRSDGSHFLRLVSPRAINDPFIDLILESNWASGRIVRDYTMLFDPPALRQQPLTAESSPAAPASPARAAASRAPAAASRAASPSPSAAAAPSGDGKQVKVQAGDTAGKIASANKPAAVSLDQMLVAMLRSNPDAFAGGNVNRLRAGAVLEMPSSEQAALVPPDEAKQTLVAQSRDFNEFRRRLAEGLPATRVAPAERQTSGRITAQVEEKRPAAATPDKLTLSKGAAQGKTAAEEKIARDRAAQDTAKRVAELNKNIGDLSKLGTATAPAATAPAAAASVAKPGVTVPITTPAAITKPATPAPAPAQAPAPAPMVAAAPLAAAAAKPTAPEAAKTASAATAIMAPASSAALAASQAAPSPAMVAAASAPAASASVAVAPAAPPVAAAASVAKPVAKPAVAAPAAETSLVDELMENPLVLGGVGLMVLALAGLGFYRVQQRKKSTQVDSSFLESRLQPDSFFGASGGQRIDTNESSATGSSMVYSPSQLDAAGDVDPVAEADVYLAYGRDLQAEEILKEAMRTQPQRVAIHAKLLEIYAKRRDAKAFELVASEAYSLTHGAGPEWEHICDLGRELDPSNSLYRPGGQPVAGAPAAAAGAAAFGATVQMQATPVAEAPNTPDIDLDLDFSLGDDEPAAPAATATSATERTQALPAPATEPMPALDMDFGSATVALAPPAAAPAAAAEPAPARLDAPDLTLDENALSFDLTPAAPAPSPVAASPAPAADAGMIEFDLGALSLDLPGGAKAAAPAAPSERDSEGVPSTAGSPLSTAGFDDTGGDPLATKLALAQEFNAIGDPDGARSLAQEVVAEASGDLKNAAQRFLAEIS